MSVLATLLSDMHKIAGRKELRHISSLRSALPSEVHLLYRALVFFTILKCHGLGFIFYFVLKASFLLVHRQYLFLDETRPHHHFHPLVVRSVTLEALDHSYFHVMTATVTMDFLPLISPMETRCFLRSLPIIDASALYEIIIFEMHWPFNKGLMEAKRN